MFKLQSEFPLLALYKKHFPIHDGVIFAYNENIYTNYRISKDLIVHEQTHLKQQREMGVNKWVELYLSDINFRAKQEEEAYRNQLLSIKDKNKRYKVKMEIQKVLDSGLYGDSKISLID